MCEVYTHTINKKIQFSTEEIIIHIDFFLHLLPKYTTAFKAKLIIEKLLLSLEVFLYEVLIYFPHAHMPFS